MRKLLVRLVPRSIAFTLAILCWNGNEIEAGNPLSRWSWRHPVPQGLYLSGVTYGNGRFVSVGWSGTIITSSDGQDWTLISQSQFPWLHSVIYGGGLFVAGGDSGAILTSINGLDWTAQTSGTTSPLLAVAYNPQSS